MVTVCLLFLSAFGERLNKVWENIYIYYNIVSWHKINVLVFAFEVLAWLSASARLS